MSLFRRDPRSEIESELRERRPRPSSEFVDGLAKRMTPSRSGTPGRFRLGVAIAATAALVGAAGAFGGYGEVTSGASHAVKAVSHVVIHTKAAKPHPAAAANSARHQYKKVHMCHDHHQNIEVAEDDVPAHLAAGDTLGKCERHHHH